MFTIVVIIGPPNGPVLFCLLAYVVVCNAAGGPGAWAVGLRRNGRVVDRTADTARRASTVTGVSLYVSTGVWSPWV